MLKAELITLRDPPQHINSSSPKYNPNAKCAYHSNGPGHDTDICGALKNKIQDMIEAKEIEFDPPAETLNVINAPSLTTAKVPMLLTRTLMFMM